MVVKEKCVTSVSESARRTERNSCLCTRWKGVINGNFTLPLFANLLHIMWVVEGRLQNGTELFFLICDFFLTLRFINCIFLVIHFLLHKGP